MSSNSPTPGGGYRAARRLLIPVAALVALVAPAAADSQSAPDPFADVMLPGAAAYQALAASPPQAPTAESPTGVEIAASQNAYTDLSDAQALALLRREHGTVVDADTFPDLEPPAGDELAYRSPFTAVIGDDLPAAATDDPGKPSFDPGTAPLAPDEVGRNVIIESTVPIAAAEQGELAAIDGGLDASGDSFTVENAAVEPEIPAELDDGIELGDVDTTVTPSSTDGAEAVPVAGKLFYPASDTDTDTLVTPTPTGVEIFFQLRSPDAPAANAIDVDVPARATLVETADGGAAVVDGAETLIAIPPASAWDAAQRPIPVRYEVAGDTLDVVAEIDDPATLWPVIVDPIIDYYPWGDTSPRTNPNLTNWYAQNSGRDSVSQFFAGEQGGVVNRFTPGYYANGDWAQWVATPIGRSYIETVQFWNVSHAPTAPGSCAWMAIWSGANWTWGGVWDSSAGSAPMGSGAWRCGPVNHVSYAHYTGSNPYPDGEGGDPESADGSVGIFGLYENGSGTRAAPAEDILRSATVWRGDRNSPGIPDLPTSAWTTTPDVPLTDAGLGVAGFGVYDPATNTWPGGGGPGCDGSHTSLCPGFARLPISGLPEGRHTYQLQAFDPLWNASPLVAWTARIDRSAPAIAMSGPLMDRQISQGQVIAPNESFSLSVNARDGSTTNAESERSGVRWASILVDGQQVAGTSPQSCPQGNCSASTTWTFNAADWSAGPHKVVAFAIDQLGHTSSREITVGVAGPPLNTPVSTCTLGPEEATTAADDAALAVSEPAQEIPEQPDRGSTCLASGPQTVAHRTKGCRRINHRETWSYPGGAFAYWLSYSSRFCWNENTGKTVKKGESYLDYDLSDLDSLTTNMEHYGEAPPVYERWGGSGRGKVIMEADFELEECFAIIEVACDTQDRHLYNRGRADGSARMYWSD